MPLPTSSERSEPSAPRARARAPRAALHAALLGRRRAARDRAQRPRLLAALAGRRSRTSCAPPRSSDLAARTSSGELEVSDLDRPDRPARHASGRPRSTRRARAAGARRAEGVRAHAAAARAPERAAPTRPPPQPRAGRARGAPPLRRLQRLLRALPRRLDDVQLRGLLARRRHARGGPAREARADLPEARRCARTSACSTSAAAGARSCCMPRSAPRRARGRHHARPPRRRTLARERVRAAGLQERVEIRLADYRDLAGERFDAIASIGMVEHVGSTQIDDYARRLARLLAPGGRLLNQGIARLRHSDPEAGAFSERYVFPGRGPTAPLARARRARARGLRDRARRGLPGRLRPDAQALG